MATHNKSKHMTPGRVATSSKNICKESRLSLYLLFFSCLLNCFGKLEHITSYIKQMERRHPCWPKFISGAFQGVSVLSFTVCLTWSWNAFLAPCTTLLHFTIKKVYICTQECTLFSSSLHLGLLCIKVHCLRREGQVPSTVTLHSRLTFLWSSYTQYT